MLCIFLISGLGGNIATLLFGTSYGISAGSSGAIFGLLGVLLFFSINERAQMYLKEYFFIDRNSLFFVTAVNLYFGFSLSGVVNNWAHLGGLVVGFVCAHIFYLVKSKRL